MPPLHVLVRNKVLSYYVTTLVWRETGVVLYMSFIQCRGILQIKGFLSSLAAHPSNPSGWLCIYVPLQIPTISSEKYYTYHPSYCDDDIHYTSAFLLHQLTTQMQWLLDRVGELSLIVTLCRKHKKFFIYILNQPPEQTAPSFNSTAWSYNHAAPRICTITIHTPTTTHVADDRDNTLISSIKHHTTNMTCDKEFRRYRAMATNIFFGITHTLTGDIK